MNKPLFELKDIRPQLSELQIKELEHIIYMAKETNNPQRITNLNIVVFPSGKMYRFIKEICTCGQEFEKHIKIDLPDKLGIIHVCPNSRSGLIPSIFKRAVKA